MVELVSPHWEKFKSITFTPQLAAGDAPLAWARTFGAEASFEASDGRPLALEAAPLRRQQVRELCRDERNPVWLGYLSAMAWGGQGTLKTQHAVEPLKQRAKIEDCLHQLREGVLNRSEAYDMFRKAGIKQLGPSYFTKLIYFFDTAEPAGRYIMDQWTAKSVNLLTGRTIVHLTSGSPTPAKNTGASYEAFCLVVDHIAQQLGQTGDEVEQRLFSIGGKGVNRGPWRRYLTDIERYAPAAELAWARSLAC